MTNFNYAKENITQEQKEENTLNLSLTDKLAFSTIKIDFEREDGSKGSGTGFFFHFYKGEAYYSLLITNKHVIKGSKKGFLYFTLADKKFHPRKSFKRYEINNFEKAWILHEDDKVDLAAMPLAPIISDARKKGLELFYVPLDKSLIPNKKELSELTAVEDILMVGYPIGLWDEINNYPIFRKGITATHPAINYNGRNEFIIDAASFPGSSGSPVFLFNIGNYVTKTGGTVIGTRFKLLGVLYGGPIWSPDGVIKVIDIPTKETGIFRQYMPINLGYVIKSEEILYFEKN